MKNLNIEKQINGLKEKINKWNHYYYNLSKPLVSDYEYDLHLKELITLEKNYPQFLTLDSPTQRINLKLKSKLKKISHQRQLYSLQNIFNFQEFKKFNQKCLLNFNNQVEYLIEKKIDGLTVVLNYNNGILVSASTRGDGFQGEDVLSNIKTIFSIPLKIKNKKKLVVIGEIYITKKQFKKLNQIKEENNEPLFSSLRNAASGSVRLLDPNITKKRKLKVFVFDCYFIEDQEYFKKQSDKLLFLKNLNFTINNKYFISSDVDEINSYFIEKQNNKELLEYETDGLVIKINDIAYQKVFGYTSKYPRWALAWKYETVEKITKLIDIIEKVGRTGKINYIAHLEPIKISGSMVEFATLHNYNYIKEKDIRIGDYVFVKKAGDIIPEIIKPFLLKRKKDIKVFKNINNCPSCNSKLEFSENHIEQYCNNKNCKSKEINKIIHFCSKVALNINFLGEKTIKLLYKKKIIENILDIYKLKNKKTDLLLLKTFKEKKISNILESIEDSKKTSAEKLLFGLGIKNIGLKKSTIILKYIKNIENLFLNKNIIEQLKSLNFFGDKICRNIKLFIQNKENQELIEALKKEKVNLKYIEEKTNILKNKLNFDFENKKFLITGKLSKIRQYYIDLLESYGGICVSTISKNLNYLIVGEKPGSKLKKAKALNIKIIFEKDLF